MSKLSSAGEAVVQWVFTTVFFAMVPFGVELVVRAWSVEPEVMTVGMRATKGALLTLSFTLVAWTDFVMSSNERRVLGWVVPLVHAVALSLFLIAVLGYGFILYLGLPESGTMERDQVANWLVLTAAFALAFSLASRLFKTYWTPVPS